MISFVGLIQKLERNFIFWPSSTFIFEPGPFIADPLKFIFLVLRVDFLLLFF